MMHARSQSKEEECLMMLLQMIIGLRVEGLGQWFRTKTDSEFLENFWSPHVCPTHEPQPLISMKGTSLLAAMVHNFTQALFADRGNPAPIPKPSVY